MPDIDLQKPIMGVQTWVWVGGVAIVAGAFLLRSKKSSSTANTNGTLPTTATASGSTPASLIPQFVNQNYTNAMPPVSPSPAAPPSPPTGSGLFTDLSGAQIPYLYGSSEVQWAQQNIGNFNLTPQIATDISSAYNQVKAMYGASIADQYHYAWYSNNNVTAVAPQGSSGLSDIKNLPNAGK